MPGKNGCDSYCEQSLTAIYGREIPFHVGVCQNATTCSVANGEGVTITNTYTVNIGFSGSSKRDEEISRRDDPASIFTAAFDIGASYSWSKAVSYTTTTTFTKVLDGNTCGYWTFIPYYTTYVLPPLPHTLPTNKPQIMRRPHRSSRRDNFRGLLRRHPPHNLQHEEVDRQQELLQHHALL
jgi:hypothetical protein